MTVKHSSLTWTIVMVAALLAAACNPIPAEPPVPTTVPAPLAALDREPMQASLYDFAFIFADFEGGGIQNDPELYAEVILKIRDCIEAEPSVEVGSPYTPGQLAALE